MKRKAADDVRLSKELSRVLRHAPPASMDASGWVSLPVLLLHLRSKPTEADIRSIVLSSDKQRFVIDDSVQPARIRAAQGHSVVLDTPVLTSVMPKDLEIAVHITSEDGWKAIQESGHLSRMKRTHIHFATLPSQLRKNQWATVLLQLNTQGAADAGHALLTSTNDVLLVEGPLPATLLTRVDRMQLPAAWHASAVAASAEPTKPTTCQPDKDASIAAGPAGSSSTTALHQEVKQSPANPDERGASHTGSCHSYQPASGHC
ncbi:MAG: hypothetical protein WDW38_008379 [Sanguina aurantia]